MRQMKTHPCGIRLFYFLTIIESLTNHYDRADGL